jgi:hypothetical protein
VLSISDIALDQRAQPHVPSNDVDLTFLPNPRISLREWVARIQRRVAALPFLAQGGSRREPWSVRTAEHSFDL